MDLTLSEPYRALQAEIRDFVRRYGDRSPKVGGGRKRPDQKTWDWQKRIVEHGYAGPTIPKEYGGFGAMPDVMEAAVIAGEFARANVFAGLTDQGISMLVPTLPEVGTDALKRQYIGPTIRGDIIWCQGYSEPGTGSDLAATAATLPTYRPRPNGEALDRQRPENLDVSVQAQIVNLMPDLQDRPGLACLFVAHDLSVVKHVSRRVAVMYVGRSVEIAPTTRLFSPPRHPYTGALLSAVPVPDPRRRAQRIVPEGDVADPSNPPSGCHFHPRCRYATDRRRTETPVLREIAPGQAVRCLRADEISLMGVPTG